MNTPGKNDGVLRGWIDGTLAFEKTDVRMRDVPDLKIETIWMNVYYGGTEPAPETVLPPKASLLESPAPSGFSK